LDKRLIIAEKPSVAMNYADALGSFVRHDGFLENSEFIVSWALGHLVVIEGIAVPSKWKYDDLPLLPEFKLYADQTSPGKLKQLNILGTLVKRTDVKEIIIGTDAGREGELIGRYILAYIKNNKPVKRLWISSQTKAAVNSGMNNLKPSTVYDHLYAAARARNIADWLVGINATRAYTTRTNNNELFSVGRVQTPTLAMVVNREKEIGSFKPEQYFVLVAETKSDKGTFMAKYVDQIKLRSDLQKIMQAVHGQSGIIGKYESKQTKQYPPLLMDLTELQRQCNKRFGWTAAKTLELAQQLYEKKLISYPRTNCRYLPSDIPSTFITRLGAVRCLDKFIDCVDAIKLPRPTIKVIDDNKIDDHYAIIPLETEPKDLSGDLLILYELIASYFIAIFYSATAYKEISIDFVVQGYDFRAHSKTIDDIGFRFVPDIISEVPDRNDEEMEEKQPLPVLNEGDTVNITNLNSQEKTTTAPKRYTEADILHAMKNASKKSNIDVPGDWGLGTAATRAAILETLKKRGYIRVEKKTLHPTEKGIQLIDILMTDEIKSPDLTATWEDKLVAIEKGQIGFAQYIEEIKEYVVKIVTDTEAITVAPRTSAPQEEIGKCPACGSPVIETKKAFSCSAWHSGCKFAIWKEIAGKKISEAQAKKLLSKGRSDLMKGFNAKQGGKFDAYLVINENMKIGFQFDK